VCIIVDLINSNLFVCKLTRDIRRASLRYRVSGFLDVCIMIAGAVIRELLVYF